MASSNDVGGVIKDSTTDVASYRLKETMNGQSVISASSPPIMYPALKAETAMQKNKEK